MSNWQLVGGLLAAIAVFLAVKCWPVDNELSFKRGEPAYDNTEKALVHIYEGPFDAPPWEYYKITDADGRIHIRYTTELSRMAPSVPDK